MHRATITDPVQSPYPFSKEEVSRRYYEEKEGMKEIAEAAGTSRQRLGRWMNFWNLPRRSCAEGVRTKWIREGRESLSPNWSGGKWLKKREKEWRVYAPSHPRAQNSSVAEHILVAEKRIGRFLEEEEVVHHLDLNHANNVPENLCVMTNSQHKTLHNVLGDVGIGLLVAGKADLVLPLVPHRCLSLIQRVYVEGAPCVSKLETSGASPQTSEL
jgi:hypothetical protein